MKIPWSAILAAAAETPRDLHLTLEVGEREVAEVAAGETEVGTRAADLGEIADGVKGIALDVVTLTVAGPRRPRQRTRP